MYRLSENLAREILSRIRTQEVESSGPNAFLPKSSKSIGILDPICCIGSDYDFVLESPVPVVYPELPFVPSGIQSYFLYRREELQKIDEPWDVQRLFLDPTCIDAEERIDVREAAVQVASDVDKLVAPTITSMSQLLSKEPLLLDCLNLDQK
jgi:hypothetical protein